MSNKLVDKVNNVDEIQENISNTIDNFKRAEKVIEKTDDEKIRETLEGKNERREEAINAMRTEIKPDSTDKRK
jgi:small acid-soluble spore protein (thioredoxin-like protein)